jgi:hypothetical protein
MDKRPFRQRYYAVIGFAALGFCAYRVVQEDYGIAIALGIVGAVLLTAAAFDRS